MKQVSLKKLICNKDLRTVISNIFESAGAIVSIEDPKGVLIMDNHKGDNAQQRYPVKVAGEVIGWVLGDEKASSAASLLSYLAEREFELKILAHDTLDKYKELTLLYDISEKIAACLNPREVARLLIDEFKRLIGSSCVSVMLRNDGEDAVETIAAYGECRYAETGRKITEKVMFTKKAEIFNDLYAVGASDAGDSCIKSMMCAPLMIKDKATGAVIIGSLHPVTYTAEDLKIFTTLSSQAAIAIENARLYGKLREAFLTTVYTLAETIEKRDPYTGGHTKRVMDYSLAIGKKMGLSDDDLTRLELSAILHDVGKIGISDNILLKNARLTEYEFGEIKKHTVHGEEILNHIAQLRGIIAGVKSHHERFDGKGYPDGFKGKDIDIVARIIAVADAFDAMVSDRPYKKGLSYESALIELQMNSGTQFDPDVVNAFLTIYGETRLTNGEKDGKDTYSG